MSHHPSSPPRTGYPHAALALRHAHPTLLSPLTPISNLDDLQSNAAYHPLTGLGISYTSDNPVLRTHLDPDLIPYRHLDLLPYEPTTAFDDECDPLASNIGLIPDVNMYDNLRQLDPPLGVNPLDTIRSTPLHDFGIYYEEFASLMPKEEHTDDTLSATDVRTERTPSARVIQDIMSILIRPASDLSSLVPWPSANPPSTHARSPSRLALSRSSISVKFEQTDAHDSEHRPEYANTTHSSPVLNAHLGIELDELVSKAERFKTKYPERDIDRAWLSHFAGKLSDRGELLNDFRCYVIGCDQRNKRRDHILVHVGAHIGQRPFACSVCPMRFLRKNECKRHEASHSGSRPYSCDICGQSFVRQDLVKRHVKRTHGLRDENQFGATKTRKKGSRVQ